MKKGVKVFLLFLITVISFVGSIYLYVNGIYGYLMISGSFALILFISLILLVARKEDAISKYEAKLKSMLKKFDSILVETSTIPDLEDKNIMLITNIEDMIDAAVEIRKPIYYKKEENYCVFTLIDNQDTCVYILKLYSEETPIEKFIREKKQNMDDLIGNAKHVKKLEKTANINIKKKKIEKKDYQQDYDKFDIEEEIL